MRGKVFELKVTKIESTCIFELNWEAGKKITVNLQYPSLLNNYYEQWRKAYLDYYRNFRGRKTASGKGTVKKDFRSDLVNSQSKLLYEFHHWLFSPELVEIRREIATSVNNLSDNQKQWIEVFLTCTPTEIALLPWETWEIGTDLGIPKRIRIARNPANIRHENLRPLHRKVRILAILGDDTGLNFDSEKEELNKFKSIAYVKVIGWTFKKDIDELKQEIVQNIASVDGWDILFFAGHSNESVLTGGELGIAPNTSIFISEIEDALKLAKKRGLQFAIFNSCSGINIAESLINLGLSQVAVMREPINNKVAQEFLKQFLRSLGEYKDVHESLLDASKFLKQQEKRLAYPSTYLVPSLFCHPSAELFRIKPFGIKRWLPTVQEILPLLIILFLSLLPDVQNQLLGLRLWSQAFYRQLTQQIETNTRNKPVLLIKVDEESRRANPNYIKDIYPINYSYLAQIINKISELQGKIVGIDYILDQEEKQLNQAYQLAESIRSAVQKNTIFVFAALEKMEDKQGVSSKIASLNWSLQGDIQTFNTHIEILPKNSDCFQTCPFPYLLALIYQLKEDYNKLELDSKTDLRTKIINSLKSKNSHPAALWYAKNRLHPISDFNQWFHPIIDFSLPPNKVYETISAYELISGKVPSKIEQQVVLIVPGGYEEAGLKGEGEDNFNKPLAVAYWDGWGDGKLIGGEFHAYMVHHLLTEQLVVPIPDFLMTLLAALFGKLIIPILLTDQINQRKILISISYATAAYLILSFQLYISVMLLFPCFLPLITLWNYIRIELMKNS